jgi:hypothetical protein
MVNMMNPLIWCFTVPIALPCAVTPASPEILQVRDDGFDDGFDETSDQVLCPSSDSMSR